MNTYLRAVLREKAAYYRSYLMSHVCASKQFNVSRNRKLCHCSLLAPKSATFRESLLMEQQWR